MKKLAVALCILLCVGFTLSAAVDVKADDLPAGAIASDSDLGGVSLVPGTGTAEVVASGSDESGYSNMLTLSGDALLSFQATAGETLTVTGAVPAGDNPFELEISSDSGVSEAVEGEASDGGTMVVTFPVEADGTYSISSVDGNPVSLYQVTVG